MMSRPETARRDRTATTTLHGIACREPHAEHRVADDQECVRALGRATQSTDRSGCAEDERAGRQSAWLRLYGGRRPPVACEWAVASGPDLLTEDGQKPLRVLDGMHGTRNTVPSIAFLGAKRAFRCGSPSGWRGRAA
jgi:hypothetical protein